ncbi:MFS transporter [Chitinophaga sp. GCM10012297]|uniref:MFS transporter n=1 Tax=Chitinophaga chungangae TaxID=2821488 RepID=A0ABS3YIN9_9BACT|nr:MFS transporter [Chitinophaga chungangae]MBO9154557.1 MFS transporter [Chitinophaga chungangae]
MKQIQPKKLFYTSCLSLIVTAMTFAIRARIMSLWGTDFTLSNEQVGIIAGTAFWGFTLAQIIGGPLVDVVGMKKILYVAFFGHIAGVVLTIFSLSFWPLFLGTLLIGIANGSVEAACNPLVATIYSGEKTKMLNRFHMWFPGGNVIGGLVAYFMIDQLALSWQWLMGILLVPIALYGYFFSSAKFPETERVSSGVSYGDMLKACVGPLFIFMVLCMFLTAATELGTSQWIDTLLKQVGVSAILVFVFINGIMAIGRLFAGPVVHRLNPAGMLLFSAIFAAIGLYWLSNASGYVTFAAAFVFAIGVCYFWPTMLGFVSEYIPKTGAIGLNIMGGAGMLSVAVILPFMGNWYDNNKAKALQAGADAATAELQAGRDTLTTVMIMPIILIVAFAILFFVYRNKSKVNLHAETQTA